MATATADKIATWSYINTWLYDKCGWKKSTSTSLCPPYSACSDFSSSALTSSSLVKESYITVNPLYFGELTLQFNFKIPSSSSTIQNTKPSYQIYTNGNLIVTITGGVKTSIYSNTYVATGSTSYTIPGGYYFVNGGKYASALTAGTIISKSISIPAFKMGTAASTMTPYYVTVPTYMGVSVKGIINIKDGSGNDGHIYTETVSSTFFPLTISGTGWVRNTYGITYTGTTQIVWQRMMPTSLVYMTANTITVSCT